MDNKNGVVLVDEIDHLEVASSGGLTANERSFVLDLPRIGPTSVAHDKLRFIRRDAMFEALLDVPVDPSEFDRVSIVTEAATFKLIM